MNVVGEKKRDERNVRQTNREDRKALQRDREKGGMQRELGAVMVCRQAE